MVWEVNDYFYDYRHTDMKNQFKKKKKKNDSVCTGTYGGSETSLNTVVHENVKAYEPVCEFIFWNFLKNCPQLIFL